MFTMCDCCPCCCCDWFEGNSSENKESLDQKHRKDPKGGVIKYQPVPDDGNAAETSSQAPIEYDGKGDIDVVLPRFDKIPVEKIFSFQQPTSPRYVHPQLLTIQENEDRMHYTTTASTPQQQQYLSCQPAGCDDNTADPPFEPTVFFSLYFDFQRRALTVHLQSASGLKCLVKPSKKSGLTMDTYSSRTPSPALTLPSDPDTFVLLFLIPLKEQSFFSSMKPKSSSPKFNETFEFVGILPEEIRRQSLVFRFYNKTKQNELGIMIMPLEDADMYGVDLQKPITPIDAASKTIELQDYDSHGEVLVSLVHDPTEGLISGIVLKARNLQKMDIGGLSDPYVKINLLHKGERIGKWKSTIKKKTLTPIYNESFQFRVSGMDLNYVKLQLIVLDHDVLGTNDMMGGMEFGTRTEHSTGRNHWNEIMSSPRNQFCYWHSLTKPEMVKRFSIK